MRKGFGTRAAGDGPGRPFRAPRGGEEMGAEKLRGRGPGGGRWPFQMIHDRKTEKTIRPNNTEREFQGDMETRRVGHTSKQSKIKASAQSPKRSCDTGGFQAPGWHPIARDGGSARADGSGRGRDPAGWPGRCSLRDTADQEGGRAGGLGARMV